MIKVKALIEFNDYKGKDITKENEYVVRKIGEEFEVDKKRYEYLKKNNAVELVEVIPEKDDKADEIVIEPVSESKEFKEIKESIKKATKKSKKKCK